MTKLHSGTNVVGIFDMNISIEADLCFISILKKSKYTDGRLTTPAPHQQQASPCARSCRS
jgi:hypothetical protein